MKKNKHKKVLLFFILFIMVSSIAFADTIISLNGTAKHNKTEPTMKTHTKTFTIKEPTTVKYSLKVSTRSWYGYMGASTSELGEAIITQKDTSEYFLYHSNGKYNSVDGDETVNMATSDVLLPGEYKLILRGWDDSYVKIYIPDTPQLPSNYKVPPPYKKIEISEKMSLSSPEKNHPTYGPYWWIYKKTFSIDKRTDVNFVWNLNLYSFSINGSPSAMYDAVHIYRKKDNKQIYRQFQTKVDHEKGTITLDPGEYRLELWVSYYEIKETWNSFAILKIPKDVTPEINPISNKTINEGQQLKTNIVASCPEGNSLSYKIVSGPSGSSIVGNQFRFTPSWTFTGNSSSKTVAVKIEVDNGLEKASETFNIKVNEYKENYIAKEPDPPNYLDYPSLPTHPGARPSKVNYPVFPTVKPIPTFDEDIPTLPGEIPEPPEIDILGTKRVRTTLIDPNKEDAEDFINNQKEMKTFFTNLEHYKETFKLWEDLRKYYNEETNQYEFANIEEAEKVYLFLNEVFEKRNTVKTANQEKYDQYKKDIDDYNDDIERIYNTYQTKFNQFLKDYDKWLNERSNYLSVINQIESIYSKNQSLKSQYNSTLNSWQNTINKINTDRYNIIITKTTKPKNPPPKPTYSSVNSPYNTYPKINTKPNYADYKLPHNLDLVLEFDDEYISFDQTLEEWIEEHFPDGL
ncbi:MAG: hypothetical protein ACOCRX_05085 [Candidatus Woesearchaeota archaeon]